MRLRIHLLSPFSLAALLALMGCQDPLGIEEYQEQAKVISDTGASAAGAESRVIGVNAYIWQAALETVGFMPLLSSDPAGGVIITDWYTPPATPEERFKIDVYVLGTRFNVNSVRVALFRQVRDFSSGWVDAPTSPLTVRQLENKILERAYHIRKVAESNEG
jgi:hypothetical protein